MLLETTYSPIVQFSGINRNKIAIISRGGAVTGFPFSLKIYTVTNTLLEIMSSTVALNVVSFDVTTYGTIGGNYKVKIYCGSLLLFDGFLYYDYGDRYSLSGPLSGAVYFADLLASSQGGTVNAADVVTDSMHRFATDTEKTTWNAGGGGNIDAGMANSVYTSANLIDGGGANG